MVNGQFDDLSRDTHDLVAQRASSLHSPTQWVGYLIAKQRKRAKGPAVFGNYKTDRG